MNAVPELAHAVPLRDPRIYLSLWVLETTAALARVSVADQPVLAPFLAAFWGLVFAAGLIAGHSSLQGKAEVAKSLGNALAAIGMFAFILALGGTGLVGGLLTLVTWLLAAKNCTLASKRDLFFAVAISLALLLYGASESTSSGFLAITALYVLAALYTLLLTHAQTSRAAAVACAGQAETLRRFPAGGLSLTLAVLLAGAAIYLLTPRLPPALLGSYMDHHGHDYSDREWERQADLGPEEGEDPPRDTDGEARGASRETAGFDPDIPGESQLDPGRASGGGGAGDNPIVLYVQAPQPLFLAGQTYDRFDGVRWGVTDDWGTKLRLSFKNHLFEPPPPGEDLLPQLVSVERDLPGRVFAAHRLAELDFPGTVIAVDGYGDVRLPRGLGRGTRYRAESRIHWIDGRPAYHLPLNDDERERYLQLPDDLDPALAQLAASLVRDEPDPLRAAIRLEQHLRSDYRYTLDPPRPRSHRTALSEFLLQGKAGFCQHFASGLAVLLRLQGIPARVVTGFSATHQNPVTGYFEVRQEDGHAWVEAHFAEQGWVQFEPTPAYLLPGKQTVRTAAEQLQEYLEQLARIENALAPGSLKARMLYTLADALRSLQEAVRQVLVFLYDAGVGFLARYGLSFLVLAVLLGGLGRLAWRHRAPLLDRWALYRLRRARGGEPRRFVLLCYRELEAWFARRGLPRTPAWTVEEYAGCLVAGRRELARPVDVIARGFIRVRYGQKPVDEDAAESCLRAFLEIAGKAPGSAHEKGR